MPGKARRHHRISALIAAQALKSQEQLRRLLAREGIDVTQATLSRDLKELGVVKGPAGFSLPDAESPRRHPADELARALAGEMLGVECAAAVVVLRTRPGHANALAVELDRARAEEVVGTIAGDDTIFIATRNVDQARRLQRRMRSLAGLDRASA